MDLLSGDKLRPISSALTVVGGDAEILLQDGSEGAVRIRHCFEEAMQVGSKHLAESVECICLQGGDET